MKHLNEQLTAINTRIKKSTIQELKKIFFDSNEKRIVRHLAELEFYKLAVKYTGIKNQYDAIDYLWQTDKI